MFTSPNDVNDFGLRDATVEEQRSIEGGSVIDDAIDSLKLMGEILSNVSKTRSEISMTFARNARA